MINEKMASLNKMIFWRSNGKSFTIVTKAGMLPIGFATRKRLNAIDQIDMLWPCLMS